MARTKKYPTEVRERAVRLVLEHQEEYESRWAAVTSIAQKFGCAAVTLNGWVRQAEVDNGVQAGTTTSDAERIKDLERENRELRRANEILKSASARSTPDPRSPGCGSRATRH